MHTVMIVCAVIGAAMLVGSVVTVAAGAWLAWGRSRRPVPPAPPAAPAPVVDELEAIFAEFDRIVDFHRAMWREQSKHNHPSAS